MTGALQEGAERRKYRVLSSANPVRAHHYSFVRSRVNLRPERARRQHHRRHRQHHHRRHRQQEQKAKNRRHTLV